MTGRTELVEQIVRLLDIRLLDPLEVLLEDDDVVSAMRAVVRVRAGRWADEMRDGDDMAAGRRAMRLTAVLYPGDRAFDPPAEWWQTPLGQVTARRLGHPGAHAVSYATAGAMLGITRQGVHDLVRRGRLPRHPDGGVPSAAVRDRLRALSLLDQPTGRSPGVPPLTPATPLDPPPSDRSSADFGHPPAPPARQQPSPPPNPTPGRSADPGSPPATGFDQLNPPTCDEEKP